MYRQQARLIGILQPFTADGRVRQAHLGNGLWDTYDYATPGTSTVYSLGTTQGGDERMRLEYNFSDNYNNGNLIYEPDGSLDLNVLINVYGIDPVTASKFISAIPFS